MKIVCIGGGFSRWDDIDIHFNCRVVRSGGHGFIGIGRKKLLNILQARCEELGGKFSERRFRVTAPLATIGGGGGVET